MRISSLRNAQYDLYDCFSKLRKGLQTPELVGSQCMMTKAPWTAGHLIYGRPEGYVNNNGLIKVGGYLLQAENWDVKNLSLLSKLFPRTAVKKANNMLQQMLENIYNTSAVDREVRASVMPNVNPHTLKERLALLFPKKS